MKFSIWIFWFKENVSTSIEEVVFWRYRDVRNTKLVRCVLENTDHILGLLKEVMTILLYFTHILPKKKIC